MAATTPAFASDDEQLWITGAATVKLGGHFRVSEEVVTRLSDDRDGLYEVEINTLLGYQVADGVTIWAGYTHDPNYNGGDFSVMEHRGREQVTFDRLAKIGRGTLSGRLRLEQRWREGIDGTAWRLRPYLKYSLPFREGGKTALVLSHESFVDFDRTNFQRVRGEERMRNLIAVTTPINKALSLEVGYMNQHGFVRGGPDTSDHIASVAVSLSL